MPRGHFSDTLGDENFDEIALSRTVKEIVANLCFAIFGKNSKWPPFLGRGKFFENCQEDIFSDILGDENFNEIALSHTVKEIEGNLCFAIFGKIQNGHRFWGRENFCKLPRGHCSDTLWDENFDEIALSRTVKEIEANLCFAIFGKNSKIQNGRHFWGGENFLKIAKRTFLRYPGGRKFR